MNRRNLLKSLTVTAAGIAVPELIVPEKRFWALDRTMLGGDAKSFTIYQWQLDHWEMMREARLRLDRALFFGEKDTPMAQFLENPERWIRNPKT